MRVVPRWAHQLYANLRGYTWQRCPSCQRHFGGHEIKVIRGHKDSRPVDDTGLQYICPTCTAAGVGCVAWALIGEPHVGCPFAPVEIREGINDTGARRILQANSRVLGERGPSTRSATPGHHREGV